MLDWFRGLFGRGRIKVEWEGIDDSGVRNGTAKVPYTGLYNEEALLEHIKNELRYQHDIAVTDMRVVAHIKD